MTVPMYLSEAQSNWTPSHLGLEKVIGVSVVRSWLLIVSEYWYCPLASAEITAPLNHPSKRC